MLFANDRPRMDKHLVTFLDPTSFEAEQYRRLRQRIEELNQTREARVIAVTSPVASDGKTLTAINFAGALARARGARILLIDADLRQPTVASKLGLECAPTSGLGQALQDPTAHLQDFVQSAVDGSALSVVLCSGSASDTYELLTSPRFPELLTEARRRYDYVIVDTPPIVPVPDGGLIRRAVDGYVLVVGANSTPRKLVGEALNLLEPNSVLGLVFNRDDRPFFGYYQSYYRKYLPVLCPLSGPACHGLVFASLRAMSSHVIGRMTRGFWAAATCGVLAGLAALAWRQTSPGALRWETAVVLGLLGGIVLTRAGFTLARRHGAFTEGVLILGRGAMALKLVEELEHRPAGRFRLIGLVDDAADGRCGSPDPACVGSLEQLAEIIRTRRPARIVIAMQDRRGRVPEATLLESRFRGIGVEEAVSFYERLTGKLAIESLRPSALILSDGFRQADGSARGLGQAVRRGSAVAVAGMALVLLAPVLALFALAIKLDSSGPVLFVQDRVGLGGRPFPLIKFRTMRSDEPPASEWVIDNEDRITRVGRWLRRFRLDELPQLLNVIRGQMSLVGPRPHPVSNYQLFLENIPYYGLRATVRPGVTGWAQVRFGYANGLEEETEKMRYDLYYIKRRSLRFDARIVLATLGVVVLDRRSRQRHQALVPVRPLVRAGAVRSRPAQ